MKASLNIERMIIYFEVIWEILNASEHSLFSLIINFPKNIIVGKSELLVRSSLHHHLRVLLLDDDTEVDDEEYFQTLPPHTTFVFTKQSRPCKSRSR